MNPTCCEHPDIQLSEDVPGALACFSCGRLFGFLRDDGTFRAFNPSEEPWPSATLLRRAFVVISVLMFLAGITQVVHA